MNNFYKSGIKKLMLAGSFLIFGAMSGQVKQLGTGMVSPYGITNDGVVVLSDSQQNYIWTEEDGLKVLSTITNGQNAGRPSISDDGKWVALTAENPDTGLKEITLYNRETEEFQYLGGLGHVSDSSVSSSWGMSPDGSTIAGLGWINGGTAHAVKWTDAAGMVDMGSTVEGRSSRANGVSNEGVIVGWQDEPSGSRRGVVWDADGNQKWITDENGNRVGEAGGISGDGKWTFGGGFGFSAYRYNIETEEMFAIPHPNQGMFFTGSATATNQDGSIFIGYYRPFPPNPAAGEGFIWTEETGLVKLADYLESLEIDTEGINFTLPMAISPDGTKIGGIGTKNNQMIFYLIDLAQDTVEGCLDAPNGQWMEYTPMCLGIPETVATIAWTGEYSIVHLFEGEEYTFMSSIETDYITISNEEGTEILAAGTSPLVWTPESDIAVRYYLHVDEDCNSDEEFRDRLIQCGEKIVITEPDYPCVIGDGTTSSFDNGYNITLGTTFRAAQQFEIEEGYHMLVQEITIDVNPEAPVKSAIINIREDISGIPGNIIHSTTMTPSEALIYGAAYGDPVVHLVFELEDSFELTAGSYWLESQMSSASDDSIWLLATSTSTHEAPLMRSSDDGASWTADPLRMVFFVAGDCSLIGIDDHAQVHFSAYPNPVVNTLNITSEIEAKEIVIHNMLGQQVLKSKISGGTVDVSALPAGIYATKVLFENGRTETFRITKK